MWVQLHVLELVWIPVWVLVGDSPTDDVKLTDSDDAVSGVDAVGGVDGDSVHGVDAVGAGDCDVCDTVPTPPKTPSTWKSRCLVFVVWDLGGFAANKTTKRAARTDNRDNMTNVSNPQMDCGRSNLWLVGNYFL